MPNGKPAIPQTMMTVFVSILLMTSIYAMLMKGMLTYYLTNLTIAGILAFIVFFIFRVKAPHLQGAEYMVLIAGVLGFVFADQISSHLKFEILPLDITSTGAVTGPINSVWILLILILLVITTIVLYFKKPKFEL